MMKKIGRTDEGSHLVEMSHEEYLQFEKLCGAIEGRTLDQVVLRDRNNTSVNLDLSGTFGAIRAYTLAKFATNGMRRLLNEFDAYLERSEEAQRNI